MAYRRARDIGSVRYLSALTGLVLFIQGCAVPTGLKRPTLVEAAAGEAAGDQRQSPEQNALAHASCFGGVPLMKRPSVGPTELLIRQGYALDFSSIDKVPLWVCESVSAEQLSGHIARRNVFSADPDLKGPKSYPDDYGRSGYDRGHQAPAGN